MDISVMYTCEQMRILRDKNISQGRLVLTPLNNILYNANVENLKQHGLHPRYLHLLVHYPMLYGPLSLGIIRVMLAKAREGLQDNGYRPFYYGNILIFAK